MYSATSLSSFWKPEKEKKTCNRMCCRPGKLKLSILLHDLMTIEFEVPAILKVEKI